MSFSLLRQRNIGLASVKFEFEIYLSFILFFSLPLQNWEIINTAVLTGKQISHAMKVFVVSYAGKISDVTRQSVCQIEDDSVLKVIFSRHQWRDRYFINPKTI